MIEKIVNELPCFTFDNDVIRITGKSIPLDAAIVWNAFIGQLKIHIANRKKIEIIFNLEIFNSSSSLYLTKIFDILNENRRIMTIVVNWVYDERDESMMELGEIYQERYDLFEFNLKSKK